jgi:hypothetical protein
VDIERTHVLFMNAHFKPFAKPHWRCPCPNRGQVEAASYA